MIKHDMPMQEYLAHSALSASDLKILLNKTPYHFANRDKIVKESDSLTFGTLAHTAILEPEVYAQYAIQPQLDKRTKAWKEWLEANSDKPSVSLDDAERINLITDRLKQVGIWPIFRRGTSETTAFAQSEGTWLRSRADKWDTTNRIIVDLKTTRDLAWFHKDIFKYGYDISVPHYKYCFSQASGMTDLTYIFVAVESEPPYDCGWFVLSRENEDKATARWHLAVAASRTFDPFQGYTTAAPTEI
jgi:hypothetical protein